MDELVGGGVDEAGAGDEVARVREVILVAYPDVVPELVTGGSATELLASVEGAREAYRRIAERVQPVGAAAAVPASAPVVPVAPTVPAGATPAVADPGDLPTHEMIRRGIAGRAGRRG